MQFETLAHLLHGRRLTGLSYSDAKAIGDSSFPNVTHRDITQRAQARARLIEQYRHRWTHEYLTSLREFQTKGKRNRYTYYSSYFAGHLHGYSRQTATTERRSSMDTYRNTKHDVSNTKNTSKRSFYWKSGNTDRYPSWKQ
ncbi:hypothetical protein DPMN_140598 [Dreissena polymorpha]|uniref:Uncharacterized protein n=1 Tax=Dreissena polymorpha TaxID=45954 RepID=A0A9D4GAQ7_DREPO|nr:hypothetical protein DPMN_140598 [Dreissena polymorpha]